MVAEEDEVADVDGHSLVVLLPWRGLVPAQWLRLCTHKVLLRQVFPPDVSAGMSVHENLCFVELKIKELGNVGSRAYVAEKCKIGRIAGENYVRHVLIINTRLSFLLVACVIHRRCSLDVF